MTKGLLHGSSLVVLWLCIGCFSGQSICICLSLVLRLFCQWLLLLRPNSVVCKVVNESWAMAQHQASERCRTSLFKRRSRMHSAQLPVSSLFLVFLGTSRACCLSMSVTAWLFTSARHYAWPQGVSCVRVCASGGGTGSSSLPFLAAPAAARQKAHADRFTCSDMLFVSCFQPPPDSTELLGRSSDEVPSTGQGTLCLSQGCSTSPGFFFVGTQGVLCRGGHLGNLKASQEAAGTAVVSVIG